MTITIAIIHASQELCDRDTEFALSRQGMIAHPISWDSHSEQLMLYQGFIIQGEQSERDAQEAFPLISSLKEQALLGKPIIGMGEGARLLIEVGLVPGLLEEKVAITLSYPAKRSESSPPSTFKLTEEYQLNAFTHGLSPNTLFAFSPQTTAARFHIPPALLLEMKHNGQLIFHYCEPNGAVRLPLSSENIAAISNKKGNIMAVLPLLTQSLQWEAVYNSMREYISEGWVQHVHPLHYLPR